MLEDLNIFRQFLLDLSVRSIHRTISSRCSLSDKLDTLLMVTEDGVGMVTAESRVRFAEVLGKVG